MVEEKGISLSAYARHRGISPQAVSKEVQKGRLKRSVTLIEGRPRILAVAAADREWEASSRRPAAALPPGPKAAPPRPMRPAQRWAVMRMASGNVAVFLFDDAEAQHDREYEDQFVGAAHALTEPPPVGPDGLPEVFVEMSPNTARELAASLLEATE